LTAASIRPLSETDYPLVIRKIDSWWGGRSMVPMPPRLFFEDFASTSLAAESEGEIAAFLVAYDSPARPGVSHVHFIGVDPEWRGRGLGRLLYETFFAEARRRGQAVVVAVTSPSNLASQRFHLALGFVARALPGEDDPAPWSLVWREWDGPGEDRIRFERIL
jgi:ribosomal protein S18 acetylase RimI-like enzyme